jgi:predicted RNA-binding protein with PIN domain
MHWLVDGMNVIGSRPDGWWRDRGAAMAHLVERLEAWAHETGDPVTVVFEREPRPPIDTKAIEVAHAPRREANAADHEIVRRLQRDPAIPDAVVVTSDRDLAERAQAAGATIEPAARFRARIENA